MLVGSTTSSPMERTQPTWIYVHFIQILRWFLYYFFLFFFRLGQNAQQHYHFFGFNAKVCSTHKKDTCKKPTLFCIQKYTTNAQIHNAYIHWLLRIWMSVLVYVFFFCILSLLCWTMNVAIAINVIHVVWYLDYTSFFSAIASKKHTRGIYSTG